jgi:CHAT domain-containing protein
MSTKRIVLAEYFTTEDETLLFGVRADREEPEVISLPLDQNELRRFVRTNFGEHNRVRELITDGLEELWHGYDYLIEPIAQWADPEDIVYIVPHGMMHYLPLHALKLGDQYFIERNPVVYSPSASVLKYCQANRKNNPDGTPARRTAVIFGDSRGDLRHARTEAEALSELFGVTPLLGNAVTRDAFQQNIVNVDIVHFAGHGDFDASQAMESGLRLAGNTVLTAREVLHLEGLHAHLVTLCGCETGISENRSGDELIGLTRAFLYAGTPSLIVSLWRVADASTAFLMMQFYKYLRQNPTLLKVNALRQAILDTKTQPRWASFYHWAPFVLIGDYQ